MRLFLALDLPEPVRARVAEVIERERATVDARWVRSDGLHLTLVFFGDLPPQMQAEISPVAKGVAARHRRFELELRGAGTFGAPKLDRVLWLGVDGALAPLQALVTDLATSLGVVSEHPVYRAHLTLARSTVKHGDPLLGEVARRLEKKGFGALTADHLTLYESAGGRYRALERFELT